MAIQPTELVYSSHDRCEHIHRDWLVERALRSERNKTIFYLPVSSGAQRDQEYSWSTFSWYFDRFRQYGLEPRTFFYRDDLRREDAQLFFDWLLDSEVVILGGGAVPTGMWRYRVLGERLLGRPEAFVETLRQRQAAGRLTAGFSAGAAQLCEYSCDSSLMPCLGLIWKVVVSLHYEDAAAGYVQQLAERFSDCLVFGLPNDSGLAACCGVTGRGSSWQHLQLITDGSWDKPEDQWHIRTRQGVKIEHRYPDGRNWSFNGGDVLVRVFDAGGGWEAWIKRPEVPAFYEYGSQRESRYHSFEDILGDH